jgi:hypothetical protein
LELASARLVEVGAWAPVRPLQVAYLQPGGNKSLRSSVQDLVILS